MKLSKRWEIISLIAMLAAAALVYWFWLRPQSLPLAEAQSGSTYQTTAVRTGNISLSASGTGTLVAGQSADLAFSTSGTVSVLNAQLGQAVSAGQVLAQLDTLPSLQQAVTNAQLTQQVDQNALDSLTSDAQGNLAQALSAQAAAQAALVSAQDRLLDAHDQRCPTSTIQIYWQKYIDAVVAARPWQEGLDKAEGVNKQYFQQNLTPILLKMELALQNYTYCQAYTPSEIANSKANLQVAQANLAKAQTDYQNLKNNNGLDPVSIAIAQATLDYDQWQLQVAQANLNGATLSAPFAGIVTAVNGAVGENAGTSTFISLADLSHPQVQASIDEADVPSVSTGCKAAVVFTSLPNATFTGTVSQIEPQLVSSGNAKAAQLLIDLKTDALPKGQSLVAGMSAAVTLTCAEAQNVLLAPVQALHQANGSAYVYVLSQGKPVKTDVEIGLKDSTNVEIRSGLKQGDRVITSQVKLP
jgi:HlyD family secretion protein